MERGVKKVKYFRKHRRKDLHVLIWFPTFVMGGR